MKIVSRPVSWWNGYDTLIVAEPPRTPSKAEVAKVQGWIEENKPTMYVPIPFEEFLSHPPWRHFPQQRWEAMERADPTDLFRDRKVMDVGCSTGYYSFLAAAAGAEKVIAIETYAKARDLLSQLVEIYGFENIEVPDKAFGPRSPMLRKPDVILAFSVLPYFGKHDPEPLKKVLKAMANHAGVSFIEMGDGGSELSWCIGDDSFRELFLEAGFSGVTAVDSLFSSHTNTYRTLWRCNGR